jgi:hypothetical protein
LGAFDEADDDSDGAKVAETANGVDALPAVGRVCELFIMVPPRVAVIEKSSRFFCIFHPFIETFEVYYVEHSTVRNDILQHENVEISKYSKWFPIFQHLI